MITACTGGAGPDATASPAGTIAADTAQFADAEVTDESSDSAESLDSVEAEAADLPTVEATKAEPGQAAAALLPVIGPAPAWQNDVWINSEALPLEDLRGKVVLLEFWTFG